VKRRVSIGLAVVLLLAVVAVIVWGRGDDTGQGLTTVRGVIGSEKQAFFTDRRVVDAFARHGLKVEVRSGNATRTS
jgi:hypothetical protein